MPINENIFHFLYYICTYKHLILCSRYFVFVLLKNWRYCRNLSWELRRFNPPYILSIYFCVPTQINNEGRWLLAVSCSHINTCSPFFIDFIICSVSAVSWGGWQTINTSKHPSWFIDCFEFSQRYFLLLMVSVVLEWFMKTWEIVLMALKEFRVWFMAINLV